MVIDSELELYVSGGLYSIRENFGINLIWSEIAGLRQYLKAFCEHAKKDDSILPPVDGLIIFMDDYFSLYMPNLKEQLGTEEFKKYCQSHVNYWREKRTLI